MKTIVSVDVGKEDVCVSANVDANGKIVGPIKYLEPPKIESFESVKEEVMLSIQRTFHIPFELINAYQKKDR